MKRIIPIIIIIIIIILIITIINNKKIKIGNNIIGNSKQEISNNILNINSYKAKIEVTIKSNKNENKYIIKQEYKKLDYSKQEIIEPANIEGLTIINQNNKLKIENSKLNLSKIYDDYNYISNNRLFLDNFIKNFTDENDTKIIEETNEIKMKVKIKENNKYLVYETLTIDKKTKKPTKLEIKDINENTLVYILYNEIELNKI